MVLGKYKINKPLARLTKKNDREREKEWEQKIRNERGDITADTTEYKES